MKKFNKLFIILLCCVGAMSVTSCLSDDGDSGLTDGLTDEERAQYFYNIDGTYSGGGDKYVNILEYHNNDIDKLGMNDRIKSGIIARFARRDSSFTVSGIPARLFTKEIKGESYKAMKEAIEGAPNQLVTGKFFIPSASGNSALLYFYPTKLEIPNLTYGGATHNVSISFVPGSLGQWAMSSTNRAAIIPLYVGTIYEDNKAVVTVCDGSYVDQSIQMASLLQITAYN